MKVNFLGVSILLKSVIQQLMWLTLGEGGIKCGCDCCIGLCIFLDMLLGKADNGGAFGLSHGLLGERVPWITLVLSPIDLPPMGGSFILSQFLTRPFSWVGSLFLGVPSP